MLLLLVWLVLSINSTLMRNKERTSPMFLNGSRISVKRMNGSKKTEEPDILKRLSQFLRLKVLLNLKKNKRKRRKNNLKRKNNQRKNNLRRKNPRNKNKNLPQLKNQRKKRRLLILLIYFLPHLSTLMITRDNSLPTKMISQDKSNIFLTMLMSMDGLSGLLSTKRLKEKESKDLRPTTP